MRYRARLLHSHHQNSEEVLCECVIEPDCCIVTMSTTMRLLREHIGCTATIRTQKRLLCEHIGPDCMDLRRREIAV